MGKLRLWLHTPAATKALDSNIVTTNHYNQPHTADSEMRLPVNRGTNNADVTMKIVGVDMFEVVGPTSAALHQKGPIRPKELSAVYNLGTATPFCFMQR